jgi:hypothetical protein
MKNSTYILIFLTSFLLSSFSCRKNKDSLESELAKLPPITQTGANTFGCLINGKAWTPKGYSGNKPNFFIIVDPSFNGGDIDIRTYRITDVDEGFSISAFPVRSTGVTEINQTSTTLVVYDKYDLNSNPICPLYQDSMMYRKGYLKITNYDLQKGIVSGEFEVKIFKPSSGCSDTLRITNGRFDYKF